MVDRRIVISNNPALEGVEWPVFEARGEREGPRLTLIAGIHGCEYTPIAAVRAFMRDLDTSRLAGSILAVPIASPTSFSRRSAFVVPEDGRNLNRSFPGRADGSFTEALADHIFREFITGSDFLIDLHSGDLFEALEPFVVHSSLPEQDLIHRLASAFNFPYVVRQRRNVPDGTTSAAAADVGVGAIIAEAGGCGLLEPSAINMHLNGLQNALRAVGLLEGPVVPPPAPQFLSEELRWCRCRRHGWWTPNIRVGEMIRAGQRLGTILDPYGDEIDEIRAPISGVVAILTTSPAVSQDGLLIAIAGGLTRLC